MKKNQPKILHLIILSLNLILKNLHSQLFQRSLQDLVNDRHHQLPKLRVSQVAVDNLDGNN